MTCIDAKWDIGQFDVSLWDTICSLLEPVHPTEIIVTTSQVNRASIGTSQVNIPSVRTSDHNRSSITTSEVNKASVKKSSVESSSISITE